MIRLLLIFINDGNTYPAVGISFGIVPICEILGKKDTKAPYDMLIIPMGTELASLKLANSLRDKGIKVMIEMSGRKLKKVLESADKNGVAYVAIIGDNEINSGTLEIKDMIYNKKIKVGIKDIDGICEIITKR